METRVALIGVIVEQTDCWEKLNAVFHDYSAYIISRMGVPYKEKDVCIISVAVDAPNDVINALSGKIGRLPGVTAKTIYSHV